MTNKLEERQQAASLIGKFMIYAIGAVVVLVVIAVVGLMLAFGGQKPATIAAVSTTIIMEQPAKGADTTMVKPATPNLPAAPKLPIKGQAPDFDNQIWINSPKISLADLKGKVVLVEFWTFSCINCQNVQPSLKKLYENYAGQGLEIVAFHDPEFDYEKKLENVQQAVKDKGIKYPVAIDNDFKTWNSYKVRAWPTMFLVDKQGQIRYTHIGEGAYDEIEASLLALLNEK